MNGCCTMICVQCHLQKYLHRSKKVWIMHGKDGLWNTWIGDQIQVHPTLPLGDDVTCGIRKQGDQVKYDLERLIRIPGTIHTKIITEITYGLCFGRSLYGWKDKNSNESNLTSEHHPIPGETSKQWGVQNLSGCGLAIFWPDGLCIELSPIGVHPRVGARPQHPFGRPPPSHIPS
jgi:hypothetical protein